MVGVGVIEGIGVSLGMEVGVHVGATKVLLPVTTHVIPQLGKSKVRTPLKYPSSPEEGTLLKSASHQSRLPLPFKAIEGAEAVVGEL